MFLKRLYDRIFDADIFNRAAQVAFYFSFSIFPLLLFLVSVFGIVLESSDGLRSELYVYLYQLMPPSAYRLVQKTVEEVVENSSSGKLTFGLFVTLWSASAGVDSIRSALNGIFGLKETRSYFWTKAQSLLLTLLVIAVVAAALGSVFYGWQLFEFLLRQVGLQVTSPLVLGAIQWISVLVVVLFLCDVFYSWVPDFKKLKWHFVTTGSLVAITLWLIFSGLFRLYLEFFNTYNRTYGSLGAVIILMLWLYLASVALLIGGAINAVLYEMRKERELDDAESNEEDAQTSAGKSSTVTTE